MKLDRLLAITMLLLNRKKVSAKELAERFEVSLRTIYRDMETINQAGIPVISHSGAAGGYEIMDRYRLERQYLSEEELHSIIAGLKGISSTLDDREIGNLLDKVGALVARSEHAGDAGGQLLIDLNPWRHGGADKTKLHQLRAAIREAHPVRFHYTSADSAPSERDAEPMGLVLKGYIWYLYGYCRLREDYRIFRLSRMERLATLPETFERREATLQQLDDRWKSRGCGPGTGCVPIALRFQPGARARLEEHFAPEAIAPQPDGTLLVRTSWPNNERLHRLLLSFGTDVRVLEPAGLAQAVRNMAQQIADMYIPILT